MSLVNALKNDLNHFNEPFNHWTLENPLSETLIDEVYDIKFPEGDVIFDGTRAGDKTGNNLLSKLRVFITKENSSTTAITTNCDVSSMSHTKMRSAWQSRCDATRMGIAPNVVIVRVSTT